MAAGLAMTAAGALLWLGSRAGLGRLPGDLVVERPGFTLYVPVTSMLLLSLAAYGVTLLAGALRR